MGASVGISLGRTISSIALMDPQKAHPMLLPTQDGQVLIPSVVNVSDQELYFGSKTELSPRAGDGHCCEIFWQDPDGSGANCRMDGKKYSREELSVHFLRWLKENAESALHQPIDNTVIAVPVGFSSDDRMFVLRAAGAAGLRVKQLLSAPGAAAIAFGLTRWPADAIVLACHLDYYSFDLTLLRIVSGKEPDILAKKIDSSLGTISWEHRMTEYIARLFESATGLDLLGDPEGMEIVRKISLKTTKRLLQTSGQSIRISADFPGFGKAAVFVVRAEFEDQIAELLERSATLCKSVLDASKLSTEQLADILLTGSSYGMAQMAAFLQRTLNRTPLIEETPGGTAALGAAIYASTMEQNLLVYGSMEDLFRSGGESVDLPTRTQPVKTADPLSPPPSCPAFDVSAAATTNEFEIVWSPLEDRDTSYRLVRSCGDHPSGAEKKETILLDNSPETFFTDSEIQPGILYTYSVFAVRGSVYSAPVSKTCIICPDVQNLQVKRGKSGVCLTWQEPKACIGATVLRSAAGKTVTLSTNARSSFIDREAVPESGCTYTVCAIYRDGASPGIRETIPAAESFDDFTITAAKASDNSWLIRWSIMPSGIELRVTANQKVLAMPRSEQGSVRISLPPNQYCTIQVLAKSSSGWVASKNQIQVHSFEPCTVDPRNTSLEELQIVGPDGLYFQSVLNIRLNSTFAPSVTELYYTVRTDRSPCRWATVADVNKAADIRKVTISEFQKTGRLFYQDYTGISSAFYITVFTVFTINGKEVLSEPQTTTIPRPLIANLFWDVSFNKDGSLSLWVRMEGNQMIRFVPELLLCSCDNNQFIISPEDKNVQLLKVIPAQQLDPPAGQYNNSYNISGNLTKKTFRQKRYSLFLKQPENCSGIAVRRMEGLQVSK